MFTLIIHIVQIWIKKNDNNIKYTIIGKFLFFNNVLINLNIVIK